MNVTRNGHTFTVSDNDLSGTWGFWDRFADGTWEPEILDRIPELLDGGTYLDIGSWIGPQLLVASRYADRCIGFEPDPTAFDVLAVNVAPHPTIEIYHAAISNESGWVKVDDRGDSTSQIGHGTHVVPSITLADAVEHYRINDVQLVKIDIEGAERYVLPEAEPTLRGFDCPVFLSLHPAIGPTAVNTALWKVEEIAPFEVLLWPN